MALPAPVARHPSGDEPENLGAHGLPHRTAVAARAYRVRIGPEQVTEITGDVTLKGSFDQAADGVDVFGLDLEVVPAGDRENRHRDAGQRPGRVTGHEVLEPAGIDPHAVDAHHVRGCGLDLCHPLALDPDDVGPAEPEDDPGRPRQPGGQHRRLPGEHLLTRLRRHGQQHDSGDIRVRGHFRGVNGPFTVPHDQQGESGGPAGQPAERGVRVGEHVGHARAVVVALAGPDPAFVVAQRRDMSRGQGLGDRPGHPGPHQPGIRIPVDPARPGQDQRGGDGRRRLGIGPRERAPVAAEPNVDGTGHAPDLTPPISLLATFSFSR